MAAGEGYLVAWWVEEKPPRNFHLHYSPASGFIKGDMARKQRILALDPGLCDYFLLS